MRFKNIQKMLTNYNKKLNWNNSPKLNDFKIGKYVYFWDVDSERWLFGKIIEKSKNGDVFVKTTYPIVGYGYVIHYENLKIF